MQAPLKIVWRQTAPYFIGCVLAGNTWFGNTIQGGVIREEYSGKVDPYYLLALLNSKFIREQYSNAVKETGRVFPQVKLEKLRPLPIKIISKEKQKQLIQISKKIEILLSEDGESDITELQNEINSIVYKLYELTYDEVKVIDPEFNLSKKEYEAMKLE
jgi:adenine-specific DNA-methyltransferase